MPDVTERERRSSDLEGLLGDAGDAFHEAAEHSSTPTFLRGPWKKLAVVAVVLLALETLIIVMELLPDPPRVIRQVVGVSEPGGSTAGGEIAFPRELFLRMNSGVAGAPEYLRIDWSVECRRGTENATDQGVFLETDLRAKRRIWPLPIPLDDPERCSITAVGTRDGAIPLYLEISAMVSEESLAGA
ncbi:MAG: hypothetical protein WD757_04390 [Actinomycetota bacterium]